MIDHSIKSIDGDQLTVALLPSDAEIPNNPTLPLLLYRQVLTPEGADPAVIFEHTFQSNGWSDGWRNGVHPFTHWHCTAHEVLGVYQGHATVQMGGPNGITVTIEAGDVVVVPAGVAHKGLFKSADLGIVGAYPDSQVADLCKPRQESLQSALQRVRAVPLPKRDPVFGNTGAAITHWMGN